MSLTLTFNNQNREESWGGVSLCRGDMPPGATGGIAPQE